MIYFAKLLYNLILYPIMMVLTLLGTLFNNKIRKGVLGRLNSINELKAFDQNRQQGELTYWFHAASFGEYEQVRPVLAGLKEVEPKAKIVVSFFSPSGYENVEDDHIDCKVYLPFDFPWSIYKMLSLIKPTKIIFAEYDVWPNVVWMAKLLNISTTVFSVHFSDHTPKLMPLVKSFYKSVYGSLTHIYAETQSDFEKVHYLISPSKYTTIKVLGNPRFPYQFY